MERLYKIEYKAKSYWILILAPAASNCFFASSASFFDIDSLIDFGSEFVNSLDSFKPSEVISRIILKIANLCDFWDSSGICSRITSKESASSVLRLSASGLSSNGTFVTGVWSIEVSTPKVSSICFTSSAASNNVIDFSFSIISLFQRGFLNKLNKWISSNLASAKNFWNF